MLRGGEEWRRVSGRRYEAGTKGNERCLRRDKERLWLRGRGRRGGRGEESRRDLLGRWALGDLDDY